MTITFNLNQWLNGFTNHSMVQKETCEIGRGTLGIKYTYQPVVPTSNGMKPVKEGDKITLLPDGDYEVTPA